MRGSCPSQQLSFFIESLAFYCRFMCVTNLRWSRFDFSQTIPVITSRICVMPSGAHLPSMSLTLPPVSTEFQLTLLMIEVEMKMFNFGDASPSNAQQRDTGVVRQETQNSGANPSGHRKPPIEYASEVRFGVVMYGGVSLAIYINGTANEMVEMVRATPKAGLVHGMKETGTREVYRRLAWLINNPTLRDTYFDAIKGRPPLPHGQPSKDVWNDDWLKDDYHPARMVVDVIAGTSAGGINGIFLAKALANGGEFSLLKNLWVQEGDIALLLNDNHSYRDLGNICNRSRHPASLLNSDRMYVKLLGALNNMNSSGPGDGSGANRPKVDEMDLFVTTTDIVGSPVPLRLSGQVVYERRHKQNFHFSYSSAKAVCRNDFTAQNNGLLAFAARCTSSFPFAFEPMTIKSAMDLGGDSAGCAEENWHKYLSYLPKLEVATKRHLRRAFGDGGYLDNKPFSYVTRTLATRQAVVPVERKLIYIEPDPQHVNPDEATPINGEVPDALSNSLAALTSIPRYETIREDLQVVLQRNRTIERVDHIIREGERDLHHMLDGESNPFVRILKAGNGHIPPWPEFKRRKMVGYYGTAFLAYRRLRVSTVTNKLAANIAGRWEVDPDSDYSYALSALVRVWREQQYQEDPAPDDGFKSINAFLGEFDIDYRIRRLSLLLRQIDHLRRLATKQRLASRGAIVSLSELERQSLEFFKSRGWNLIDDPLEPATLHRSLEALHILKIQLNEVQGNWRIADRVCAESSLHADRIGDSLREELHIVLQMLLGEQDVDEVRLSLASGGETPVKFPPDVLRDAACARTMRDSVLIRAKALFKAATDLRQVQEQATLHAKLVDTIESMGRFRITPGAWEILGKPTLVLDSDGGGENVKGRVEVVDNPILNTPEGMTLRCILGEYYAYFDLFDQMSFPLYQEANIGEPCTVEVVRISPVDAKSLIDEAGDPRRKLAGTALANFGAFIDRRWRLNDIMWGRLDGAEQLIRTLLPMADERTKDIRNELIGQAHRAILYETLVQNGMSKVADLLCNALAEEPGDEPAGKRVRKLLDKIVPGKSRQSERLADMLVSLLEEQNLIDYVRTTHDVDRTPDPKATLKNASRAVTITGRVLEEISSQRGNRTAILRWIARFGLILQGLLAVSLPGTWQARWRASIMHLLYAFELVILGFALVVASAEIRTFAIGALGITLTVHLTILLAGDLMHAKRGLRSTALAFGVAVLGGLASVGALALHNVHWRTWLLAEDAGSQVSRATPPKPSIDQADGGHEERRLASRT